MIRLCGTMKGMDSFLLFLTDRVNRMNRIFSRFHQETGSLNNPVDPVYFKNKNGIHSSVHSALFQHSPNLLFILREILTNNRKIKTAKNTGITQFISHRPVRI